MDLLRHEHGIEVKSASSTIEEVVARQFVERLARQRGVVIPPPSKMFLDLPATKAKKPSGKGAEPPKPAQPALPPPRLVRVVRPPQPAGDVAVPAVDDIGPFHEVIEEHPPVDVAAPGVGGPEESPAAVAEAPPPELAVVPEEVERSPHAVEAEGVSAETPAVESAAPGTVEAEASPAVVEETPASTEAPAAAASARPVAPPAGRMVPPSIRLRIEDPSAPTVEGRAPRPLAARPATSARPVVPAPPAPAPQPGPRRHRRARGPPRRPRHSGGPGLCRSSPCAPLPWVLAVFAPRSRTYPGRRMPRPITCPVGVPPEARASRRVRSCPATGRPGRRGHGPSADPTVGAAPMMGEAPRLRFPRVRRPSRGASPSQKV